MGKIEVGLGLVEVLHLLESENQFLVSRIHVLLDELQEEVDREKDLILVTVLHLRGIVGVSPKLHTIGRDLVVDQNIERGQIVIVLLLPVIGHIDGLAVGNLGLGLDIEF